jgi:hypothetical protein
VKPPVYDAWAAWGLTEVGGHAQLFWSSQSQFCNLKEALPQSQYHNFLKKRCSAIPQLQFFLKSAISSLHFESFTSAIFGIFVAVEPGQFMKKKLEVKNLVLSL